MSTNSNKNSKFQDTRFFSCSFKLESRFRYIVIVKIFIEVIQIGINQQSVPWKIMFG